MSLTLYPRCLDYQEILQIAQNTTRIARKLSTLSLVSTFVNTPIVSSFSKSSLLDIHSVSATLYIP